MNGVFRWWNARCPPRELFGHSAANRCHFDLLANLIPRLPLTARPIAPNSCRSLLWPWAKVSFSDVSECTCPFKEWVAGVQRMWGKLKSVWLALNQPDPSDSWATALQHGNFAQITDWFLRTYFGLGFIGLLGAAIAAGLDQGSDGAVFFRVFSMGFLFAGACGITGWLFGLLFGIPRTLSRPENSTAATSTVSGSNTASTAIKSSRVNTNLEDISDWLTKTIIGVGLTQLLSLPNYVWNGADLLNRFGFEWPTAGRLLAVVLLFYFLPGGFWLGYVGTRTALTRLFDSILDNAAVAEAGDPKNLKLDINTTGVAPASGEVAAVDRQLLQTPLESLSAPKDIMAWAAAKARAGNVDKACSVLEDLLRKYPDNQEIKDQLATLYWARGDRQNAIKFLKQAPDSNLSVLYALYNPAPDGFQKAIAIGEKLLTQPGHDTDANLHLWLACAYGQQYGYEKNFKKSGVEILAPIKVKMITQIMAAIAADPATRAILHSLWKPTPGAEDDDLKAFAPDDPELTALLGE